MNIVNVIIISSAFKHFLIKPVMDIMNKRQTMVDRKASQMRGHPSPRRPSLKSQYEEKLAASAEEGKEALEEAKAEAKTVQERMIKSRSRAGG